jgi:PAS domain S-box-containing protein
MTADFGKDDLMTILEGVNDGVIKLDRGAHYVALNRAASEIFRQLGRDPVQVIGQSLWKVFPEAKGTIVERELNRVLKEGLPTKYEFYLPPAKRWYETSAYPSKEGVILVFRDITQSKVNVPSQI